MQGIAIQLKKVDWILISTTFLLVGIGLSSLYSSSIVRGDFLNFKKQLIFLAVGIFLLILFIFFDYRVFKTNPYLILSLYFFSLLLLGGLFRFAPEVRGTKSWYKIGPFSLDPIEFVKVILIILLAKYFSVRHIEMYRVVHIIISGLYVLLPAILIFLQPNLGSVLILLLSWLGILIISGIKLRHFLILVVISILFSTLSWIFLLKDYQKARVISFIFPKIEPLGTGWNQRQAKIAIGSGGLFGQGIGKGTQVQYGFLPEAQTDFIFAAISEEMGFLGVGLLLLAFSVFCWRIIKIALLAEDNFPRLFAAGFVISVAAQVFVNIGMNLGILPIIGIPLPFVSYGGSSLIMNFISLGILQSIWRQSSRVNRKTMTP